MSFEKVGTTAFVIAQWRAEEAENPAAVCLDHIANIFINEEMRNLAIKVAKASPSTSFLVKFRTHYFDDLILSSTDNGIKQIIILGSGLDTRPIRLGTKDVRFFEIDQEHVFKFKREALSKFGYKESSDFIPCDYTSDDFIGLLTEKGVDFSQETFFLWEGNIFYLPYAMSLDVLNKINSHFENVKISFDYLSQKLIQQATGYQKSNDLLDSFSSMGAPWQTGIENVEAFANECGFQVHENFLIANYINEKFPSFRVDENLLDDYFICILSSTKTSS